MSNRLRIALTKGRLQDNSVALFERAGLDCSPIKDPGRRLVHSIPNYPLDAVLVRELEREEDADEWVFLLEHDCADLTDIVRTAFVLNMDSRLLCREDCKGLCFRCGKDLNEGPCGCQAEADPRLAVLKTLLKGK